MIALFISAHMIIGIIVCFYLLFRNGKVYDFRIKFIKIANLANYKEVIKLYDKYSYEEMLYSFKPLKLEAWFTEEEIKILKGDSHA